VPALRSLVAAGHQVPLVVTQPDRPGHRLRLTAPAVKVAAAKLGLEVFQPEKIRQPEAVARIAATEPDLIVVVAYGQIIPPSVLELPRLGVINVHASLLPRHRGAAPVQHAILAGDEVTGVTIMRMDEQLDHGPILATRKTEVARGETAGELTERLAQLGADLLVETIERLAAIQPQGQDHSLATRAPSLRKEAGELDWELPAAEIVRRLRAYTPWPGVTLPWPGGRIKVLKAHSVPGSGEPGQVVGKRDGWLQVATGDGILVLMEVQRPGRKPMPAAQLATPDD
jgi:methionyl-tRNA formyltransferase